MELISDRIRTNHGQRWFRRPDSPLFSDLANSHYRMDTAQGISHERLIIAHYSKDSIKGPFIKGP